MKKDALLKINLQPCSTDWGILSKLNGSVMNMKLKQLLIDRYYGYVAHHDKDDLPDGPRDLYLVPFIGYQETLEKQGLKLPEQSVLWLPSLAVTPKFLELMEKLPPHQKDIVVYAYDSGFSSLSEHSFLLMDTSLGYPMMASWKEEDAARYSLARLDIFILAEKR